MEGLEKDIREAAEALVDEWDKNIECLYGNESDHLFSYNFEGDMKKLIARAKRIDFCKRVVAFSKKIAAFILILVFGIIIGTVAVRANRERYIKVVERVSGNIKSYDFFINISEYSYADFSKTQYGYLPEGFEKQAEFYPSDSTCLVEYSDNNNCNMSLSFTVISKSNSSRITIDTDVSDFSELCINGNRAFIIMNDEWSKIVWSQKNVLCCLTGNISREEAKKIAENIVIFFE